MSLTVKHKLRLMGAVLVAIFIIIGITYLYALNIREASWLEQLRVTDIELDTGRLANSLLEARRREKDFFMNKDEESVSQHAAAMDKAREIMQLLESNINDDNKNNLTLLSDLRARFASYELGFKKTVEIQRIVGLDEKTGLLGALRKSVHNVEEQLKIFDEPRMAVSMLMMRRHEKDYLARKADKYVDSMKTRHSEFNVMLAKSDIPSASKNNISSLMDSYHRDFNAMVDGMKIRDREIENLRNEAHAVDPLLEEMNRNADELSDFNEQYQAEQSRLITILIAFALGTGALFSIGALIVIAKSIIDPLNNAVAYCDDIARGNLGNKIEVDSTDEIGALMMSLESMRQRLFNIVSEIRHSADDITVASTEMADGSSNLAQRTEEQASSLEETASSMEEMTSTVQRNSDNAIEAKQLAEANRQAAIAGAKVVADTVSAMSEIRDSSIKISDILGTIDGIAFQTNLLALNAAVEAARAGEQGRGFAVVASEVRMLAQRSADAARQIKVLIGDSEERVMAGSELVDQSGKTLEAIIKGVNQVADLMVEIAAASSEQSAGIVQVNSAITNMDDMTQMNAALVEEVSANSRSVMGQAGQMVELMDFFQLGNNKQSSAGLMHDISIQKEIDDVALLAKHQPALQTTTPRRVTQSSPEECWEDF
ncbi:MAG: methyl-accepting chemotaxis protein [Gammaproteobacteria bacterium]|nr:methyl-accepting chemotaxis protein [Gammaproteobacteria bacterium]